MGMFDDITYRAPCPICGAPLRHWQSKDAGCALDKLTPAQLWEQSAYTREGRKEAADPRDEYTKFYGGCNGCGTSIEIRLSPGVFDYTSKDFARMRAGEPLQRRRGPVLPVKAAVDERESL